MTRSILLVLYLLSFNLFSQSISAGGSIEVGIIGQNEQFSFGPNIKFHIPLEPPFKLATTVKLLFTEFDGIAGGNSGMITQFNFALVFSPLHGSTNPFVSLGLGYNINSLHQNGNQNGDFRIDNSFGYVIQTGVLFSPGKSYSFLFDLDYNFQKPEYHSTYYVTEESRAGDLDLSLLSLGLGVIYSF